MELVVRDDIVALHRRRQGKAVQNVVLQTPPRTAIRKEWGRCSAQGQILQIPTAPHKTQSYGHLRAKLVRPLLDRKLDRPPDRVRRRRGERDSTCPATQTAISPVRHGPRITHYATFSAPSASYRSRAQIERKRETLRSVAPVARSHFRKRHSQKLDVENVHDVHDIRAGHQR